MATDVLIVGAGLAGLVAANKVQQAGKTVTVVDEGHSVGGRLATQRISSGIADSGAQFFTVRSEIFQQQINEWLKDDLVYIWGHGWSDGSVKQTVGDGYPRYVAKEGMNHLAQVLAEPLTDVHIDTRIVDAIRMGNIWELSSSEGATFEARILIMTPPVPQSLDLLNGVPLSESDMKELKRIEYGPCLCGLFVVDGTVDLPEPGAQQNFDEIVYWIADNKAKGISDERIITMHVEVPYSRAHYDDPDEQTLAFLADELQKFLGTDAVIKESQLKKWRYSIPITTYPHDVLQADGLLLIFAGDAFGGRGRVEGAYLSGAAAGDAALVLLKS